LAICISAKGTRTFYSYRRVKDRPVRVRIGRFPETTLEQARNRVATIAGEIVDGRDPHAERMAERGEMTLGDLFAEWLRYAKRHKKTWAEDQRQYDAFLAKWDRRRLSTITKAEARAWHDKIGEENGHYAANRCLALLRSMFNKGIEDDAIGWQGVNPTLGIRKFKEESRDRFLLPAEVSKFAAGLEGEEPTVRDFFWMCLLTGARKSNVLTMRWDQLAMEGVWRIPETKNGLPVLVPLVETAQNILRARRETVGDSPWVFPGPGKAGHLVEVRKAWVRVCERGGLEGLRIHDLRRTLGSWQAAAGASETIIGKSLGHRPGSKATAVYARLQLDPVRASMANATAAMLEAAGGKGADDGEAS
jgi:integrase